MASAVQAFEAFVARKTAEADRAAIAPLLTVAEYERSRSLVAIGNAWTERLFDGPFFLSPAPDRDLPAASLVFVQSRDGNTVAKDPSALGGGDADKHLIYEGLSRVAADAVLGGAGTVRDGHLVLSIWRQELVELRAALGLPRHPVQVVATLHGVPIEHGLMFNVPSLPAIVITTGRGFEAMRGALAARPWIDAIVMSAPSDIPLAFRELRARGVARVSCIGGRTVATQLIDAGLIQDVYLTTAPQPGGEPDTPFYGSPLDTATIVRKGGTGPDEGVTFEHLTIRSAQPSG